MKRRTRPKNIRKTDNTVDDGEDISNIHRKLEESRKLQSLRSRPQGINATALAFGEVNVPLQQNGPSDTLKLSSGGLVELSDLTSDFIEGDNISKKMSSDFAAETKQRDEDINMLNYIDKEMSKRFGSSDKCDAPIETSSTYENKLKELYVIPESLQSGKKLSSEEMLSNQILSGIPEYDLGVDEKFRNIQATEEAVRQLVREQLRQEEGESSLIPTNLATNFSEHQQMGEGGSREKNRSTVLPDIQEVVLGKDVEKKRHRQDKSSDDFHFDKFVKKSKHN
ncbi:hypothetical protein LOD99_14173 [Oopsacas minuta]|uniref:Uncharacterized protein n=1 Tax=Oopsacas minuta TaxID=111878 RepID=A0AAV7KK39_9METZ|nr:hypothetical protein LOD99_14173 [Oopsacas minuta]